MSDETLSAVWMTDQPINKEAVMTAVDRALDEDRAARDKERRIRIACVLAVAVLCPALLWCAAYGTTPLVRGGYALMAAGTAIMVFAEWMHLAWSRQALPGPADARTQLQKTAFLLSRQGTLIRTAPLWCAPIFIGTALIGVSLYQERSHAEGYLLWAAVAAAWVIGSVVGLTQAATLDERRVRMEQLLSDLG